MNNQVECDQPSTQTLNLYSSIDLMLDKHSSKELSPGEIANLLPKLAALIESPEDISSFNNECYTRITLCTRPNCQVTMICWLGGQSSAIHDHGRSKCGFIVLRGEATERFFEKTDDNSIRSSGAKQIQPGTVSIGTSSDMIHQVLNLHGNPPLITLHLYSTAIDTVNVYSLESNQVETQRLINVGI